jgi:hypothetical protein
MRLQFGFFLVKLRSVAMSADGGVRAKGDEKKFQKKIHKK